MNQIYWEAASGLQSMDLSGSPGQGTLTQNVAGTVAGQDCRLPSHGQRTQIPRVTG